MKYTPVIKGCFTIPVLFNQSMMYWYMRKIQEMMKGFLKRLKHTGSPWQWERGRWRSSSAVTRAAGWPGVTPAPSSGCRCRRGWWWRRAARSKRGKGKRCKTETTAPGWAPASQCSRQCRKVLDRSGPTGPRAPPQTQMQNTTPLPPGDGHETKRTCYLIRQEMEFQLLKSAPEAAMAFRFCPPPVGCLVRLTVVWEADFEAAHRRQSCQVGQTAQAEQHAAHGVELTGDLSKQPPVHRRGEEEDRRCDRDHGGGS